MAERIEKMPGDRACESVRKIESIVNKMSPSTQKEKLLSATNILVQHFCNPR